ncbi:hypothetical protein ACE38U_13745 [Cedecea sp. S5-13]|nr:hypothetical protein [Cedecea neteri]
MPGSVGDILATQGGEALMRQALSDSLSVATAEGHTLPGFISPVNPGE